MEIACDTFLESGAEVDVDRAVQLARDIWGSPEGLRGWPEFDRLRRGKPSAMDRLADRIYWLRRDLAGRLRWRRWRWSGI